MSNEFEKEQAQEQGYEQITITFEDGEEVVCDVIGVLEVDGQDYIALIPTDDDGVLIFKYTESAEGVALGDIDSDETYEIVAEAFDQALLEAFEDADFEDLDDLDGGDA